MIEALQPLLAVLEDLMRRVVREELDARGAPASEYLSTKRAAKIADVSQETVRAWVESGALARYGAGRRIRVKRADLDAFLANGSKRISSPKQEARAAAEALRRARRVKGSEHGDALSTR